MLTHLCFVLELLFSDEKILLRKFPGKTIPRVCPYLNSKSILLHVSSRLHVSLLQYVRIFIIYILRKKRSVDFSKENLWHAKRSDHFDLGTHITLSSPKRVPAPIFINIQLILERFFPAIQTFWEVFDHSDFGDWKNDDRIDRSIYFPLRFDLKGRHLSADVSW